MKCFQIYKGEILIINDDKEYKDTLSNFLLDSGLSNTFPTFIVYDSYQGQCMIDGELKEYPSAEYERLISNIVTYIEAKEKRTYTPPKEPSEDKKLQMEAATAKSEIQAMTTSLSLCLLTEAPITSIKEQYTAKVASLSDGVALRMPEYYPVWSGYGEEYKKDYRLTYNGVLYKVLQDHTSQASWTPDAAPSLFAKVLVTGDEDTPPEWQQPDSTNAYMTGDRVTFEEHVYESLIDNNVWKPTDYPAGWKQIDTEGEE